MNLGFFPNLNENTYLMYFIGSTLSSLLLAFSLADKIKLINLNNIKLTNKLEQTVILRTEAVMNANTILEHLITELKEADSSKSQFLANMSHEIRTPLTSVIGYADSLLLGDIDKSQQGKVLKIISGNGKHLLNIINDILDITKIEAKKLDLECLSVPLFSMPG